MAFISLVLLLAVIALWSAVSRLRARLEAAEQRLGDLEHARAAWAGPPQAPAVAAPATPPVPAPAPAPAISEPAAPSHVPAAPPAGPAPRTPSGFAAPTALPTTRPPAPAPGAAGDAPSPDSTGDAWELAVGASWFNKIGAAVFVIGIALLVGHSMTTLGAGGRVAVGYALSLGMLAAGVALERRPRYRLYAYGLAGGGWAGTYFTTYAMRNVPAAQLITSDVLATALLAAVATGMIWHSLRYRSKTVTGLAYVVAFVTLGLTPLTPFSLVAALPLAVSLIVVSQRFGWSDVSALGVASSYAIFALRSRAFPESALDPATWPPYLMLAAYWLTFEAADLFSRRRPALPQSASLFALNAVGFVTAGLLQVPAGDDTALAAFVFSAAAAYAASAVVRARWVPELANAGQALDAGDTGGAGDTGRAFGTAAETFTTSHAATAIATALALFAIELRFAGSAQILALFLVAELVIVAGLTVGDRVVRHIGAFAAAFATFRLLAAGTRPWPTVGVGAWDVQSWTILAVLIAAAWIAHREWLRARHLRPEPVERGYTWAASWLLLLTLPRELGGIDAGVAGLALAAALVEAGLRRGVEYRYQAYVVAGLSASWLALRFAVSDAAAGPVRDWVALPAAAMLAFWIAGRLAGAAPRRLDALVAAGVAATFGTLYVAQFEDLVLPAALAGPAFAATALGLAWAAARRGEPLFRWHAYALWSAGMIRSLVPVVAQGAATMAELAGALAAIALTYAGTLAVRAAVRRAGETAPRGSSVVELERGIRPALSVFATVLLTIAIALEAPDRALTLLWGVAGVALLVAGFPARERVLRLSGLAVLSLSIGRLLVFDLREQEALARIVSSVALGVFLLGVSWAYTRYREQIRRYL